MSLSGEDRGVLRAIVESSDPSVKPADRLRALELLADGPSDVDDKALVFARTFASASDAELDEMIVGLCGGPELEEDRKRSERQARALADADAECDRRARLLAGPAAELIAAEQIMAAREALAAQTARADALEVRLGEFTSSGAPRVARSQGPPPGIDPSAGWGGDGRGRGGRLGGL